jgi:hypothetical protein
MSRSFEDCLFVSRIAIAPHHPQQEKREKKGGPFIPQMPPPPENIHPETA